MPLRLKRKRYPRKELTVRFRCPEHGPELFDNIVLAPGFHGDPYPHIWWRPTKALCRNCSESMEYEGFVTPIVERRG